MNSITKMLVMLSVVIGVAHGMSVANSPPGPVGAQPPVPGQQQPAQQQPGQQPAQPLGQPAAPNTTLPAQQPAVQQPGLATQPGQVQNTTITTGAKPPQPNVAQQPGSPAQPPTGPQQQQQQNTPLQTSARFKRQCVDCAAAMCKYGAKGR